MMQPGLHQAKHTSSMFEVPAFYKYNITLEFT